MDGLVSTPSGKRLSRGEYDEPYLHRYRVDRTCPAWLAMRTCATASTGTMTKHGGRRMATQAFLISDKRNVTRMDSSGGTSLPLSTRAACVGILLLFACGDAQGPAAAPVAAPLEEVFVVEFAIQLGEDPADSIAEIGDFVERRDGGFVIGDRHLPRVRSYDQEGRLEGAFGRFGEGPFEFRRIAAVAETSSGRVVVADFSESRLTYLTGSLAPDTMLAWMSLPRMSPLWM